MLSLGHNAAEAVIPPDTLVRDATPSVSSAHHSYPYSLQRGLPGYLAFEELPMRKLGIQVLQTVHL